MADTEQKSLVTENRKETEKQPRQLINNLGSLNLQLLPLKLVYFFEYAKEACLAPYLILFYTSIGMSPMQGAAVNGLRFVGGIIGAPLLGLLADKTRWHRTIAVMCTFAATINCLQPFVPYMLRDSDEAMTNRTNRFNVTKRRNSDLTDIVHSKLYVVMLLISIIGSSFETSTMTFVDSGVLLRLKALSKSSNVGHHRVIGPVGYASCSLAGSLLVTYFATSRLSPYTGIFVIYFCVLVGLGITFYFLFEGCQIEKIDRKKTEKVNISKLIFSVFSKYETFFFLTTVLLNGIAHGLFYGFSLFFLEEIGAPAILLGLSNAVNGFMAAIFFALSNQITRRVGGKNNAMSLSCFSWCVRYLCLYFMRTPYIILAVNLLNGLTNALFVFAYVEFIKGMYPPSIYTVMCGVTSTLYWNMGYCISNVIGWKLYEEFGPRRLFLVTSICCGVWSVINLLYGISSKHRSRSNPVSIHCSEVRPDL